MKNVMGVIYTGENDANLRELTLTRAIAALPVGGRYRVNDRVEVRGGVLNLADRQPPAWTGEGATDTALYDVLGRRFYVGVNLSF